MCDAFQGAIGTERDSRPYGFKECSHVAVHYKPQFCGGTSDDLPASSGARGRGKYFSLSFVWGLVANLSLQDVRRRNEVKPAIHKFLMQGVDKLYLVNLPHFHEGSGRCQLLISGSLDSASMKRYKKELSQLPGGFAQVYLQNSTPMLLDNIANGSSFEATV